MPHKIVLLEGYHAYPGRRKKRRRSSARSNGDQADRFTLAARACKGRKAAAFRACMRKKLKKGKR